MSPAGSFFQPFPASRRAKRGLALALPLLFFAASLVAGAEPGFSSLFDGRTLAGWKLLGKKGDGYGVKDGLIFCAKGGGGNLLTEKEYSDFILRLEYKLTPGANNGVAIRAPLSAGSLAYTGMEIQMLDDDASQYARLEPAQYNGSIYKVVAARRGALKPTGEWNEEEIVAQGRRLKITLNGKIVVDADLNGVTDPEILKMHPGILRERGHVGFLGHNDYVELRNIRIKELAVEEKENQPPPGFAALFNGRNLSGWKGLVGDPPQRAKMSATELAGKQAKADDKMRAHWRAENGVLLFDGHGDSLCTARDYRNFEMWADWKIEPGGDSGIYLRGSPQVQIWDRNRSGKSLASEGSGGLFNNEKNSRDPLKFADKPVGEWNRFRILMVGEKVHVFLNGELVVQNTTLENYWERDKPIYPSGPVELQNHNSPLLFRNIFIREIPRTTR